MRYLDLIASSRYKHRVYSLLEGWVIVTSAYSIFNLASYNTVKVGIAAIVVESLLQLVLFTQFSDRIKMPISLALTPLVILGALLGIQYAKLPAMLVSVLCLIVALVVSVLRRKVYYDLASTKIPDDLEYELDGVPDEDKELAKELLEECRRLQKEER